MAEHPARTRIEVQSIADDELPRFARANYLDLLIAAPKSVSVLLIGYLQGEQHERAAAVRTAHTHAVHSAAEILQKDAGWARDGARYHEVAFRFHGLEHIASEDTDPHLHTHLILERVAPGTHGKLLQVDREAITATIAGMRAMYSLTLRTVIQNSLPIALDHRPGTDRREVTGIDDKVLKAFPGTRCTAGLPQTIVFG